MRVDKEILTSAVDLPAMIMDYPDLASSIAPASRSIPHSSPISAISHETGMESYTKARRRRLRFRAVGNGV